MRLSTVPASSVLAELESDEQFEALVAPEDLRYLDRGTQEYCNLSHKNGRSEYMDSNLASPLPASSAEQDERRGFATASILGNAVVFSTPFAMPYALAIDGYKNGQKMGADQFDPALLGNPNADTRTDNGFIAFAAEDDVTIEYRAYKSL
jgi:hypothetical protein